MYNTIDEIYDYINSDNRDYKYRLKIGDVLIDNSQISLLTTTEQQESKGTVIGITNSTQLNLELIEDDNLPIITWGEKIKVEIGFKIHGVYTYIPQGEYTIYEHTNKKGFNQNIIKVTAFDNMFILHSKPFFTELKSTTITTIELAEEISKISGIGYEGGLSNIENISVPMPKGDKTCRTLLGMIAGISGLNCIISYEGKIKFTNFYNTEKVYTRNNVSSMELTDNPFIIQQVTCGKDKDNKWTKGNLTEIGMEISYQNEWMTEELTERIYNKIANKEFYGFKATTYGNPLFEQYDMLKFKEKDGKEYNIMITGRNFNIANLSTSLNTSVQSKNSNTFTNNSDVQTITKFSNDIVAIKEVLSNTGKFGELYASNIKFKLAEGEEANLGTLISNIVDMTTGTALNLTVGNTHIDSEFVREVIAKEISVDDLKAGTIDTDKFRIISKNGKLYIADNTITIKDENDIIRVQLGENAEGDYGFYLWNQDGQLVFGKDGKITSDGIGNNVIKNVNIGEKIIKDNLDIEGIVKEINDNGDLYLYAKTIKMEDNRSLEVAFRELVTTVRANKQLLRDSLNFDRKDVYVYFEAYLTDNANNYYTDKYGNKYVY